MSILKTFSKNFKFYGLINYIKIIFFEIFYQIFFIRFSDFKTNRPLTIKFKNEKKSYDTMHLPTPYYFLRIINSQLVSQKKIFIDFGCGNGRVLNYFSNKFSNLIGFDINLDFLSLRTSSNNIKVKKINLRKLSLFKKKFFYLKKKIKFYFSMILLMHI